MRICVAQTRPVIGDLQSNVIRHKSMIEGAASGGADIIVFPELSLTGYEPKLAKNLATNQDDSRFDVFQRMSDAHCIAIGVGMPISSEAGILIGMVIFQPQKPRQTYFKRHLHADELPYFVNGGRDVILEMGVQKIAPAICYESLLPEHSDLAAKSGANLYIASVAKSARGVEKAIGYFPEVARKHSMTVFMSNCVGPCDNFVGAGRTSVWNNKGVLVEQLSDTDEGILIFDTESQEVLTKRTP